MKSKLRPETRNPSPARPVAPSSTGGICLHCHWDKTWDFQCLSVLLHIAMETDLRVGATSAPADLIIETDTWREVTCVLSASISSQSVILFFPSVSQWLISSLQSVGQSANQSAGQPLHPLLQAKPVHGFTQQFPWRGTSLFPCDTRELLTWNSVATKEGYKDTYKCIIVQKRGYCF